MVSLWKPAGLQEASPILVATSPAEDKGKPAPFGFYRLGPILSQLFHQGDLLIHSRHQENSKESLEYMMQHEIWQKVGQTGFISSMAWKWHQGTLPQRQEAAPSAIRLHVLAQGQGQGWAHSTQGNIRPVTAGSLWAPGCRMSLSVAALCQGHSSCLGGQMRNKHKQVQNAVILAWFAEGSHHEEMTNNIQMGRGLKRVPEWCGDVQEAWLCVGLKPRGVAGAERAFQLCSPQTKARSHGHCWHHRAWGRSCWFAKLHVTPFNTKTFWKKSGRGCDVHFVKNI